MPSSRLISTSALGSNVGATLVVRFLFIASLVLAFGCGDDGAAAGDLEVSLGASCGAEFVVFESAEECPQDPRALDCNVISVTDVGDELASQIALRFSGTELPSAEIEISIWHVGGIVVLRTSDALQEGEAQSPAGDSVDLCLHVIVPSDDDDGFFDLSFALSTSVDGTAWPLHYVRFQPET